MREEAVLEYRGLPGEEHFARVTGDGEAWEAATGETIWPGTDRDSLTGVYSPPPLCWRGLRGHNAAGGVKWWNWFERSMEYGVQDT